MIFLRKHLYLLLQIELTEVRLQLVLHFNHLVCYSFLMTRIPLLEQLLESRLNIKSIQDLN